MAIDISIIICTYNRASMICKAIESAINQKDINVEVICVDDGSTDNTYEIVNNKYKGYDNFIYIKHDNIGLASSRNKAIKIASGKYIQFLDSDDYLVEDGCKKVFEFTCKNKLDICTFSGINIGLNNEDKNKYWEMSHLPAKFINRGFDTIEIYDYYIHLVVSSCLSLYNKEFIERINNKFPDGYIFEDNLFFYTALFKSNRYGIFLEKIYRRVLHDKQITNTGNKKLFDIFYIKKEVFNLFYRYTDKSMSLKYGRNQIGHMLNLEKIINDKYKKEFNKEINNYISYCIKKCER